MILNVGVLKTTVDEPIKLIIKTDYTHEKVPCACGILFLFQSFRKALHLYYVFFAAFFHFTSSFICVKA